MALHGLKIRSELIKDPKSHEIPTIFHNCVSDQDKFEQKGEFSELDYIVFLTLGMFEEMIKNNSLPLNRGNHFNDIYFNIFGNIFDLGLKDGDNGEPISDINHLKDYHFEWINAIPLQQPRWKAIKTNI